MHSFILSQFPDDLLPAKITTLSSLDIDIAKWQTYPDIHTLSPTINKNTVNKTKSIKIEDIRALQTKLSLKPHHLPYHLAIIKEAETLTLASQNAFLKLLEETPNSYIFLITNDHHAFISTIQSRCQLIINPSKIAFTIDPKFEKEFEIFQASTPFARLKLIEKYQKTLNDSQELVLQFLHILRNQIAPNNSPIIRGESNPAMQDTTGCVILLKNLESTYQDLNSNINRKLALDQLCLKWNQKLIKLP